jgi:hypothetical protein
VLASFGEGPERPVVAPVAPSGGATECRKRAAPGRCKRDMLIDADDAMGAASDAQVCRSPAFPECATMRKQTALKRLRQDFGRQTHPKRLVNEAAAAGSDGPGIQYLRHAGELSSSPTRFN